MSTRAVGNRRLLKLADYLEALPRGRYDQEGVSGVNKPKCAIAHTWDMPQYKRVASRLGGSLTVTDFYALHGSYDWNLLFDMDGCKQPNGKPAKTGKQAAKFIRKFVAERST